jgi:hypothetical protein
VPDGVAAERRQLLAGQRLRVPRRQLVVRRRRVDQCREDEDGHG